MLICPYPFSRLELGHANGFVPCCRAWLSDEYLSLIKEDANISFYDRGDDLYLWNSKSAKLLRTSILDGSFRYCLREKCKMQLFDTSKIPNEDPDHFETPISVSDLKRIEQGEITLPPPSSIALSADRICNLACTTCRDQVIHAPVNPFEEYITNKEIEYVKKNATTIQVIRMSNTGEVFFSPKQKELLKSLNKDDYPNLKHISIISNGTLVTKELFEELRPGTDFIKKINISMDAGSEEVYKKTRKGNWKQLVKNLEWISSERQKNRFVFFTLLFVVRNQNYKDIPSFIALAERLKVDRCQFVEFDDRDNIKADVINYKAEAVHLPEHDNYFDFLKIYEKFKSHPLAQFNISGLS